MKSCWVLFMFVRFRSGVGVSPWQHVPHSDSGWIVSTRPKLKENKGKYRHYGFIVWLSDFFFVAALLISACATMGSQFVWNLLWYPLISECSVQLKLYRLVSFTFVKEELIHGQKSADAKSFACYTQFHILEIAAEKEQLEPDMTKAEGVKPHTDAPMERWQNIINVILCYQPTLPSPLNIIPLSSRYLPLHPTLQTLPTGLPSFLRDILYFVKKSCSCVLFILKNESLYDYFTQIWETQIYALRDSIFQSYQHINLAVKGW